MRSFISAMIMQIAEGNSINRRIRSSADHKIPLHISPKPIPNISRPLNLPRRRRGPRVQVHPLYDRVGGAGHESVEEGVRLEEDVGLEEVDGWDVVAHHAGEGDLLETRK